MIHDCLFCSRFFTFLMLKCYMIFRGITSICPTFSARKFLAFRPWGPPDLRSWRPPRSWASSWYPGPTCHPQRTVRVLSLECCGLRHKIWRYGWYQDIIVDAYSMSIMCTFINIYIYNDIYIYIYVCDYLCIHTYTWFSYLWYNVVTLWENACYTSIWGRWSVLLPCQRPFKERQLWQFSHAALRSTWSWDFARSETDVWVRIPSVQRCYLWDVAFEIRQGWHVFGGVHDQEKAIFQSQSHNLWFAILCLMAVVPSRIKESRSVGSQWLTSCSVLWEMMWMPQWCIHPNSQLVHP